MAAQNMPAAEVDITDRLVRTLLVAQHRDLADLPLTPLAFGWDNAIFRLGDELLVRLPRRQLGADLVEHEHRWLPGLASILPIPIPAPVRLGVPGSGFPWRWSVCPYFDGEVAADVTLADPRLDAQRLGEFVAALHRPAPADAPVNEFRRGKPIAEFIPRIESNLAQLDPAADPDSLDNVRPESDPARTFLDAARAALAELADVTEWDGPALWVHGDLHSANIVVADGAIAAVIDFGDITSGDPAVDLAVAWMLFDETERQIFRTAAAAGHGGIDDATWQRGRLWALHFAVLYLLHSADNPRFRRMGTHLLAAVTRPER